MEQFEIAMRTTRFSSNATNFEEVMSEWIGIADERSNSTDGWVTKLGWDDCVVPC